MKDFLATKMVAAHKKENDSNNESVTNPKNYRDAYNRDSNLYTMKNAKINRHMQMEKTLFLERNLKNELKENIKKIKGCFDPLKYSLKYAEDTPKTTEKIK